MALTETNNPVSVTSVSTMAGLENKRDIQLDVVVPHYSHGGASGPPCTIDDEEPLLLTHMAHIWRIELSRRCAACCCAVPQNS